MISVEEESRVVSKALSQEHHFFVFVAAAAPVCWHLGFCLLAAVEVAAAVRAADSNPLQFDVYLAYP